MDFNYFTRRKLKLYNFINITFVDNIYNKIKINRYIMKLIIRTIVFHMLCILFFSLLYFRLAESFEHTINDKKTSHL